MTREEAIKEIKSWDFLNKKETEAIETLIPELRESEDERIRKALIDGVRQIRCKNDITQEQMIAYLEKQKEPHYTKRNALFDKCVENCDPKTIEEVNKRVDDIMNMSELSAFEQALTNFIGYWEDDEERWPSKFVKKHGKHILDMARVELQKEQKPAEWSEEDELNIGWLIAYLKGESAGEYYDEMMRESLVDWLKSLKNRGNFPKSNTNSPSWKPSEEQMEALLWCTAHLGGADHRVLAELYEHLRKLREE